MRRLIINCKLLFILSRLNVVDASHIEEFQDDSVNEIKIATDCSMIEIYPTESNDRLRIEKECINLPLGSIYRTEKSENKIKLESINPNNLTAHVNYKFFIPSSKIFLITAGHLNIKTYKSFQFLNITSGNIEGSIEDPKCNLELQLGTGQLNILYRNNPKNLISIIYRLGSGKMNIFLPKNSKVEVELKSPNNNLLESDFENKNHKRANFKISGSTGTGWLYVRKFLIPLLGRGKL